jgi:hypothetical protein
LFCFWCLCSDSEIVVHENHGRWIVMFNPIVI